jgi:hypothetical protein
MMDFKNFDFSNIELKLCFIAEKGENEGLFSYEFWFGNDIENFWGNDFEQKPASICNLLIPDNEDSFTKINVNSDQKLTLAEKSSVFSFQDAIDGCVSLAFIDADNYPVKFDFGEAFQNVKQKISNSDFMNIQDLNETCDFEDEYFTNSDDEHSADLSLDTEEEKLLFVRKINYSQEQKSIYKFYFGSDADKFKEANAWFGSKRASLYSPFNFQSNTYASSFSVTSDIPFDTAENQSEYSMNDAFNGFIALVSENLDNREYPDYRMILHFGDAKSYVKSCILKKKMEID